MCIFRTPWMFVLYILLILKSGGWGGGYSEKRLHSGMELNFLHPTMKPVLESDEAVKSYSMKTDVLRLSIDFKTLQPPRAGPGTVW